METILPGHDQVEILRNLVHPGGGQPRLFCELGEGVQRRGHVGPGSWPDS